MISGPDLVVLRSTASSVLGDHAVLGIKSGPPVYEACAQTIELYLHPLLEYLRRFYNVLNTWKMGVTLQAFVILALLKLLFPSMEEVFLWKN